MKILLSRKIIHQLEKIITSFESGVQTQHLNDSLEYWSDVQTNHDFNLFENNYRCIVDGEIVDELIIDFTD